MGKDINTNMIVLAREARGLNQNELAEKIHMSPTNLSKIERGDVRISEEVLEAIAEETGYPPHFFQQSGGIIPENLIYRKRQSVAQRLITPIHAQVNIIRRHVQFLTRALPIDLPALPSWPVTDVCPPEKLALKLRQAWGIKEPFLPNLTHVVEQQGIVIISFDFGTERIDSRSMVTEDGYPIIFLNNKLLGDRLRFSLAYELGGLIMHTFNHVPPHRDIASEANAFAASLLMPAKEITKDFDKGLTITLLGELKKKWKVSMISLLYRADDLGYLTPNQKRYLLQQFNSLNIRRREPVELDIPIEEPELMRRWMRDYRYKTGLGAVEMAAVLCLNVDEFLELYS
jgi:Zn-dependent peptidase ImmA (M78 family)/transcriptional regulator with XRE-family HTH domain